MASSKKVEVRRDDETSHKWCVLLGEDVFRRLLSQANPKMHKIFVDGSPFSLMLFGKFF